MNNHNIQTDTESNLLLKYTVSSDPTPLLPGQNGKVIIKLACSKTIYCDTIVIQSPQGVLYDDIFSSAATLCMSNDCWTTGNFTHIHDPATNLYYQQWTLTNVSPYGVVSADEFDITGAVNTAGGTAQLVIKENSGPTVNSLTGKKGTFPVTKGSKPLFYLQNLTAADPLAVGYPCGAFQQGHPIEISWEGNGTSYDLYQSGISTPIHSGQDTNYKLNSGISDITTFCCVASNSSGDKLFESLTLTVINPAITAKTVTCSGEEEVDGDMTTNQATCNILSLSPNRIVMAAPEPNINNLTNNSSSLDLYGYFKVNGDATFTEKLSCTYISTDNLTVQESITFSGQPESLFGPPVLVASGIALLGSQLANTDGYAIMTISGPLIPFSESIASGALSIANVLEWTHVYGGNSGLPYVSETDGFLMIPVAAGNNWMYTGENLIETSPFAIISVYWFPTGKDNGTGSENVKAPPVPVMDSRDDKNNPRVRYAQYLAAKRKQRSELIASMETMLETTFDATIKEEMIQQLMKL